MWKKHKDMIRIRTVYPNDWILISDTMNDCMVLNPMSPGMGTGLLYRNE